MFAVSKYSINMEINYNYHNLTGGIMRKILLTVLLALIAVGYAQDDAAEEQATEETTSQEVVAEESESKEAEKAEDPKPEPAVEKKEDKVAEASQSKINIAVLDLDNRGEFKQSEIKLFTDRVNAEIIKVERFIVIERQQIDEILNEQGFQQSGACSDQECLLEVGQLLAVQKVIGGSIGKVENMYPVNLKIIDVTTGKIETQVVRDFEGSKSDLLSDFIPQLANELLQKGGYVKDVEAKKKKSLFAKPVFWIPVIAVLGGGGAAAAILLTKDDDGDEGETVGDIDISDFPDHVIPIQ